MSCVSPLACVQLVLFVVLAFSVDGFAFRVEPTGIVLTFGSVLVCVSVTFS